MKKKVQKVYENIFKRNEIDVLISYNAISTIFKDNKEISIFFNDYKYMDIYDNFFNTYEKDSDVIIKYNYRSYRNMTEYINTIIDSIMQKSIDDAQDYTETIQKQCKIR